MELFDVVGMPGEPQRLDYIIKEHEKLQRRFTALVDLLFEKKLISHDEAVRIRKLED